VSNNNFDPFSGKNPRDTVEFLRGMADFQTADETRKTRELLERQAAQAGRSQSQKPCSYCKGTGYDPGGMGGGRATRPCVRCRGTGMIMRYHPNCKDEDCGVPGYSNARIGENGVERCPTCNGSRQVPNPCPICKGTGMAK